MGLISKNITHNLSTLRSLSRLFTRSSSRYLDYGQQKKKEKADPFQGNYFYTEREGFTYIDNDGKEIEEDPSPYESPIEEIVHEGAMEVRPGKVIVKTRKFIFQKNKKNQFVDWVKMDVKAGDGGAGSCHLRRTRSGTGGPDGGDGGKGGSVYVEADKTVKHLPHLLRHYRALNGIAGGSNDCHGANAPPLTIKVPVGTVLKNKTTLEDIDMFNKHGDSLLLVRGGAGGRGNAYFKTAENQTPVEFTPGEEGANVCFEVELKTIADVGLVGFPNVGKSTLLRALSRARPRVASYPFTTLKPHIGMVDYPDGDQLAVADIPGLVDGAHKNRGLGHSFLRHVERCRCLLYVVDCSDPYVHDQFAVLRRELKLYSRGLLRLPAAIIANKMDLLDDDEKADELRLDPSILIVRTSAMLGTNIDAVKRLIRKIAKQIR